MLRRISSVAWGASDALASEFSETRPWVAHNDIGSEKVSPALRKTFASVLFFVFAVRTRRSRGRISAIGKAAAEQGAAVDVR